MGEKRQLEMRLDLTGPDMDVGELPEGFTIHTDDGHCAAIWEWVVEGAFGWKLSYDTILRDKTCAPERVFFLKEYSQDIATAAVQLSGEMATLHMVAMHPVGTGRGLMKHLIREAVVCARKNGYKTMNLTTDDFRLPAIREYLQAGFRPLADDEEMKARWAAVLENLEQYRKAERQVISLWPAGNVPYFEEGECVPSVEAYPVEGSRGAVVVCPGGGYVMKASHEGGQIARMLNAGGISAFVLDYRVKPCHFEAPLSDALRAIRLVRSMGYEKVAVMGFSAGGHLACSAATLYKTGNPDAEDPIERFSSRPDAFVPCYAVVSFASFRHQGSLEALLGERKNDYDLIRRFSAELHVNLDTPPAFIWHTASDHSVPVENSLMLASALAHAGVPFELVVFPQGAHGIGLAGGDPVAGRWPDMLTQWLKGMGYAKEDAGNENG